MLTKTCIISSVLAACVAVSCTFTTSSAFATTEESPRNVSWEEKIDFAIWQSDVDESGRYLVYVSRTGISDSKIEKEFNKRSEYPLSYYKDKTIYRAKVGPEVASYALEKYGLDKSLSLEYGQDIFDDNVAPIEYELLENYNEFVMSKRNVITDLYGTYNESFAKRVGISEDAVLYEGMYTGSYVMYATRNEVEKIAKDKSVTAVSVWENYKFSSMTNSVQSQIYTDSTTGTKSTNFNNGTGYKGIGIKVGIIEGLENSYFDPTSPQLRAIYGSRLFYVDSNGIIATPPSSTSSYSSHANLVTSIIVGQSSTYENITYEGVVPNATAYQTYATNPTALCNQIQNLVTIYGVTVINFSAGSTGAVAATYGSNEQEIDQVIQNTGVSLICAVGNSGNFISTPANCFNVIAVGNVNTKNYDGSLVTSELYSMANTSAYNEASTTISNKPDIVAPGENIACRTSNGIYAASGTSFAAPLVTGVIAQILQTDETLSEYRTRAKVILLAGADPKVISTTGNDPAYSTDSTYIREKSGVGMVNAINAINIAENMQHSGKSVWFNATADLDSETLESVYLSKGQTLRVVLSYYVVFDDTDSLIDYDAALSLYRGTSRCAESDHNYCNVEVIEYTATTAGTYDINVSASYEIMTAQNSNRGNINIAWRIIN